LFAKPQQATELAEIQQMLGEAYSGNVIGLNSGEESKKVLLKIETKVAANRKKDAVDAIAYAAVRTELKKPLKPEDLEVLRTGKMQLVGDAAVIYGSSLLTIEQAKGFSKELSELGSLGDLVTAQAYSKAGDNSRLTQFHSKVRSRSTLMASIM